MSPTHMKLIESKVPEIRIRAINLIQSKFQCCRTDLTDLVVDVNTLIRYLLRWFRVKPVTHQNLVFEIILTLLKVCQFIQINSGHSFIFAK